MSSAFAPSLKASETDKKTIITISQPVAVEGTLLPAGQGGWQEVHRAAQELTQVFRPCVFL
jgi:hypothetical protein